MTPTIKTALLLSLPLTLGACGSMMLDLKGKAGGQSGPSVSDNAPSGGHDSQSSGQDSSSPGQTSSSSTSRVSYFIGLSDRDNVKNARSLKADLRIGDFSFKKDGTSFARIENLCGGAKIHDVCEVQRVSYQDRDNTDWVAYAVRVKGEEQVHLIPEMLYDIAVPHWSARVWKMVSNGPSDTRQELLTMLKDKCGEPVNTKCVVRNRANSHMYRLHVQGSSEVVLVPETLQTWRDDL